MVSSYMTHHRMFAARARSVCISRTRLRPGPWAVGACVDAGVEVLYVLIVTSEPELGLGQGACLSLLICSGRRLSAPRSAASAWRSLCHQAARPAVLSSRTDLLMLSPKLMWHHLTRGDERQISRRLTAGLVQRGKRAGAA